MDVSDVNWKAVAEFLQKYPSPKDVHPSQQVEFCSCTYMIFMN